MEHMQEYQESQREVIRVARREVLIVFYIPPERTTRSTTPRRRVYGCFIRRVSGQAGATQPEAQTGPSVQIRAEAISELDRINAIRTVSDGKHPGPMESIRVRWKASGDRSAGSGQI